MWTRLIVLCFFVKCLSYTVAICTVSKYDDGFGDWIKCSKATISEAMTKGGPVVTAITIIQSRIFDITENAFSSHARTLRMLNLQNCEIHDLHVNALDGMTLLKKLNLPNNNITTVRADWFDSLVALEQLDLSFNAIERIDPRAFARLANLRRLNLNDNLLKCLEPNDMMPMKRIEKIRVIENPLSLTCRGRMTLWFNDKGINYWSGNSEDSESWLDRVLWLCAEDESSTTRTEKTMRECVLLNIFNQLSLALKTTNSYEESGKQCVSQRLGFLKCIARSGPGLGKITNGEAIVNIVTAIRGAQEKLKISEDGT